MSLVPSYPKRKNWCTWSIHYAQTVIQFDCDQMAILSSFQVLLFTKIHPAEWEGEEDRVQIKVINTSRFSLHLPTIWWWVQRYICQFALYSRSNWSGCYRDNILNIRQLKIVLSKPFHWVNTTLLMSVNEMFMESPKNK